MGELGNLSEEDELVGEGGDLPGEGGVLEEYVSSGRVVVGDLTLGEEGDFGVEDFGMSEVDFTLGEVVDVDFTLGEEGVEDFTKEEEGIEGDFALGEEGIEDFTKGEEGIEDFCVSEGDLTLGEE